MFCPKCGSIMLPKKEKNKTVLICSCGYIQKDIEETKLKEKVKNDSVVEVVDSNQDMDSLPSVEVECPKCGYNKARFWLLQTRASDEPETKFLKCEKCKHTWRDYN